MRVEQLIKELQAVPDQQAMVATGLVYTPGLEEETPAAVKGVYVHPEQGGMAIIASIVDSSIHYQHGYRRVEVRDE